MKTVLFPIVHGIQLARLPDNYADRFVQGVAAHLSPEERAHWVPLPYNWTGNIHYRQRKIFSAVEQGLWNRRLRLLKHLMGSEVVWYSRTKSGGGFFNAIHAQLDALIEKNLAKVGDDARVALFGHSLGSQIIYNFCWETRLPKVSGLFFAGSPFAMYSGMYPDWGRLPPALSGFLINFYNRMDFIGSRLQDVHPSEEISSLARDVQVPLDWNPLNWLGLESHAIYWRSDMVWRTVAQQLKALMREEAVPAAHSLTSAPQAPSPQPVG